MNRMLKNAPIVASKSVRVAAGVPHPRESDVRADRVQQEHRQKKGRGAKAHRMPLRPRVGQSLDSVTARGR